MYAARGLTGSTAKRSPERPSYNANQSPVTSQPMDSSVVQWVNNTTHGPAYYGDAGFQMSSFDQATFGDALNRVSSASQGLPMEHSFQTCDNGFYGISMPTSIAPGEVFLASDSSSSEDGSYAGDSNYQNLGGVEMAYTLSSQSMPGFNRYSGHNGTGRLSGSYNQAAFPTASSSPVSSIMESSYMPDFSGPGMFPCLNETSPPMFSGSDDYVPGYSLPEAILPMTEYSVQSPIDFGTRTIRPHHENTRPSIATSNIWQPIAPAVEMITCIEPSSQGSRRALNTFSNATAREHYLYQVEPNANGVYPCPYVTEGCKHKADKLKCNYDKHLDSHLKPYRCKYDSCQKTPFSSTACLLRHEREAHGMHGHGSNPFRCHFPECDRGRGFPRRYNLEDHMRRMHGYKPDSENTRRKSLNETEAPKPGTVRGAKRRSTTTSSSASKVSRAGTSRRRSTN